MEDFILYRGIIFFVSVLCVSVIAAGCAGSVRRDLPVTGPVVGENVAVRSYPSVSCYKNKEATVLRKPAEFETVKAEQVTFDDDSIKVVLYAKKFAQGNAGYAEVICEKGQGVELVKLSFNEKDIPFLKTAWGWRGIFAINPREKTGSLPFKAVYTASGVEKICEGKIRVSKVDFPVSKYMIDLGKFSDKTHAMKPETVEYVRECDALREKAFSSVSEDCLTNELCHPRDMHRITGDYWKKRTYAEYRKKGRKKVKVAGRRSFHRGLDLKGKIGDPVYSMAAGRVVLAHKMFYEWNMVVVDHGNSVFSYYMHMSRLEVKEGDFVKTGALVGLVGSTGTSTGPHLHVALSIRGEHVDPLSLLSLPVGK